MPDVEWQTSVTTTEDKMFVDFLRAQIRAFNDEHSPHHRVVRQPDAIRPLHVMLKDAHGTVVGGLAGKTYWGWFEIEHFFVPVELRRAGIGSALLETAEADVRHRGAAHVFLTTFSFQARTFYAKRGYVIVGTMEGYPPGSSFFWMRKDFASDLASTGCR